MRTRNKIIVGDTALALLGFVLLGIFVYLTYYKGG